MSSNANKRGKNYGSFAERILKKQGWREGQGLGAKNQGIPEPLKPKLKFDKAGVGVDPAKEFTDHWWQRAFDAAADKIEVTVDDDDQVRVKAKKKKKKKKSGKTDNNEKVAYKGHFVKSETLTEGKVVKLDKEACSNSEDDEERVKKRQLTDEELFEACGGMTAHKGARHGHKMSAKRSRLEAMDKKLLSDNS